MPEEENHSCLPRALTVVTETSFSSDDGDNDEQEEDVTPWIPDPRSDNYLRQWNALLMTILEEDDDERYTPAFLRKHCPTAALTFGSRSPLHVAVDRRDPQPSIVQWLSEAAPELVHVREDALLPLDVLSSHILAKEEMQRYHSNNNNNNNNTTKYQDLAAVNWECVGILVKYYSRRYARETTASGVPTLHACLAAQDCVPFSLLERAMRRYRQQVLQPDVEGNLPLHICLAWRPEEEELDFELVHQVLRLAPEATRHANHAGCLPLDVALVASGKRHAGKDQRGPQGELLAQLIQANPASLGLRGRLPLRLFPFLLSEMLCRGSPDAVYNVLSFGN